MEKSELSSTFEDTVNRFLQFLVIETKPQATKYLWNFSQLPFFISEEDSWTHMEIVPSPLPTWLSIHTLRTHIFYFTIAVDFIDFWFTNIFMVFLIQLYFSFLFKYFICHFICLRQKGFIGKFT